MFFISIHLSLFYNNKNYAYDYLNPDQKYYMMDPKYDKNYINKRRVKTRELSLKEICISSSLRLSNISIIYFELNPI